MAEPVPNKASVQTYTKYEHKIHEQQSRAKETWNKARYKVEGKKTKVRFKGRMTTREKGADSDGQHEQGQPPNRA